LGAGALGEGLSAGGGAGTARFFGADLAGGEALGLAPGTDPEGDRRTGAAFPLAAPFEETAPDCPEESSLAAGTLAGAGRPR